MNVQGDEPDINIQDIRRLNNQMIDNINSKIGTLAAEINNDKIYNDQNVVKVKIKEKFDQNPFPLAENFLGYVKTKRVYSTILVFTVIK